MGSVPEFFLIFLFNLKYPLSIKKQSLFLLKNSLYVNGKVFLHKITNKKSLVVVKTLKILVTCHSSSSVYLKFGLKQLLLDGLIFTASLSKNSLSNAYPEIRKKLQTTIFQVMS